MRNGDFVETYNGEIYSCMIINDERLVLVWIPEIINRLINHGIKASSLDLFIGLTTWLGVILSDSEKSIVNYFT